jgi:hypothetical protein
MPAFWRSIFVLSNFLGNTSAARTNYKFEELDRFETTGNGATSAGGHSWSVDAGLTWHKAPTSFTGNITSWGDGTAPRVLARRERPQVLLKPAQGSTSDSYGVPQYVFTSAEDSVACRDGGPGTEQCASYTILQQVDLSEA